MKALIVTPYFAPHTGGVESYSLNVAKQLRSTGWQVVVVTSGYDNLPSQQTIEGIKVYRLRKALSVSNTPVGWRWRAQLKKIYKIEQPDVINGHVPVPYLADIAERCRGRIPFVLTYHNDLYKSKFPQNIVAVLLNRTVIRRTLRRSDHIIATSKYYIDNSPLLKQYTDKVSIVTPGVDVRLYNQDIAVGRLDKKYRGQRVILFVGSIGISQQHKGLDILIQALARLRATKHFNNTQLVVVGGGDGVDLYTKQAKDLGVADSVEFTGVIKNELLAQYYKRADVFSMPSKDRNEGFGMVFMEASATGTPVVGTSVGGVPYAVQHDRTGLIVAPDDVQALTNALKKVLTDTKLAERFGAAGAERAAMEFNWPRLGATTAGILYQVTKPTIVQIAGYYPPNLGGMERVAEGLSEKLAERKYDVLVLTSTINQPSNPEPPKMANLRIRRLPAFDFAHTAFAPSFIPALCRTPKRAVFHLHLSQAFYPEWTLLIAKLRRIPYLVHFHLDLQPSGPLGRLFLPYKAVIIRAVIKHANAVIVFSKEQQEFIYTTYGVDKKKIVIIPNGVGDEYFIDHSKHKVAAPPSLLYVGRIASQKRVQILTSALGLMHEPARLTIVGDGEERQELEATIPKELVKRITFTGRLAPEATLPYFEKAAVFVIASKVEGMPLAILEAMASGLPVVGADVPGIRELIRGVGVLVKDPSAATFARSLDGLLADPAKLGELSRKSSELAQHYSWSALIDRLELLYEEVSP